MYRTPFIVKTLRQVKTFCQSTALHDYNFGKEPKTSENAPRETTYQKGGLPRH